MSSIAEAAGFSLRIAAFFAALGLLPGRVVPFAARAALALAAICFFVPAVVGPPLSTGFSFSLFAAAGPRMPEMLSRISYERLLSEAGTGVALAILVSLAMYIAQLTAGYAAMQMAGWSTAEQEYSDSGRRTCRILKAVFSLLLLYLLFHSDAFGLVLEFFARPLFWETAGSAGAVRGAGAMLPALIGVGARAFAWSAALAVPIFVVSLLTEYLYLLQRRYFPLSFSEGLVPATRATALALLLSVSMYFYAKQLSAALEESGDRARADAAFGQGEG